MAEKDIGEDKPFSRNNKFTALARNRLDHLKWYSGRDLNPLFGNNEVTAQAGDRLNTTSRFAKS